MIERFGFRNVSDMAYQLHLDLIEKGFSLELWRMYGEREEDSQLINTLVPDEPPVKETAALYVFSATASVDPFALVEPWSIIIEAHPKYLKVWVLTPDCYRVDEYGILVIDNIPEYARLNTSKAEFEEGEHVNYGYLSNRYHVLDASSVNFLDFRSEFYTWGDGTLVQEGSTLSYTLSTDGTGVFFGAYSEKHRNNGDHLAWFAVGRLVDSNGEVKTEHQGRPVWCLYSLAGGGTHGTSGDSPEDTAYINPVGIRQFCVRESDLSYPSDSVSAVIPNNRFNAVINPLQQTSLSEDGTAQLNRIQNFSNWRYKYTKTAFLSVLCYTSADVHEESQLVLDSDQLYDVTYRAWLSNYSENKGMRLYVGAAESRAIDAGIMYRVLLTNITIIFQDEGVRLHSLNVRLSDALSGTLIEAPKDLLFTVDVLPTSDIILGSDVETADGNFTSIPQDGKYKIHEGEKQSNITFAEFRPAEPKHRTLKFRVSFPTLDQAPTDLELLL